MNTPMHVWYSALTADGCTSTYFIDGHMYVSSVPAKWVDFLLCTFHVQAQLSSSSKMHSQQKTVSQQLQKKTKVLVIVVIILT